MPGGTIGVPSSSRHKKSASPGTPSRGSRPAASRVASSSVVGRSTVASSSPSSMLPKRMGSMLRRPSMLPCGLRRRGCVDVAVAGLRGGIKRDVFPRRPSVKDSNQLQLKHSLFLVYSCLPPTPVCNASVINRCEMFITDALRTGVWG
eukprot:scaffold62339_cov59-Phaeocystis_antarctica.AAC.2